MNEPAADAEDAQRARTSVLAVAPFNIEHVLLTYAALAEQPGIDATLASLRPLPPRRRAMGWPEMDAAARCLQPWRRLSDRARYHRLLVAADVVILPGPFHLPILPFHFWERRLAHGPLLAWSERFADYRRRSWLKLRVLEAIARSLDTRQLHLLAVGAEAATDYAALGVRRWRSWLFPFCAPARPRDMSWPRPARGTLRLLHVGQVVERKRVDLVIEALAAPDVRDADWRFTVIGDGPELAALKAQAARSALGDKVIFAGALPPKLCRQEMINHDVLVLASRFDGWGLVINEAFEAGLAVVCTDAVGASMLVEDGVNGVVVPSGDPAALGSAIRRMLADRGFVEHAGHANRAKIHAWRPEPVAARLAELCRGVAGHGPLPHHDSGPLSPVPFTQKPAGRRQSSSAT